MVVQAPGPESRWRCSACGNLTRFEAVRTTKTRDYFHADLSGETRIEESEVISDIVESVVCRWCRGINTIEVVDRPDSPSRPEDTNTAP